VDVMTLNTASATISFAGKLEEDAARLYEAMAGRYRNEEAMYLTFARENRQNIAYVERAYYGGITDALEGCFAFEMDPEEYAFTAELPEKTSRAEALGKAIDIEGKIIKFYSDAARQSKALMADVPRVFETIARKRNGRKTKLEALSPG
jgi:rubrerythrin